MPIENVAEHCMLNHHWTYQQMLEQPAWLVWESMRSMIRHNEAIEAQNNRQRRGR